MNRYLKLNADGLVVNIIVWDGVSPYNTEGHTLLSCDEHPQASFGWTLDGDNWIAPIVVESDIVNANPEEE